jgi:hypothetical protein
MTRVDSTGAPHHAVRIGRIAAQGMYSLNESPLPPAFAVCLEIRLRLPQVNSGLTL